LCSASLLSWQLHDELGEQLHLSESWPHGQPSNVLQPAQQLPPPLQESQEVSGVMSQLTSAKSFILKMANSKHLTLVIWKNLSSK